MRKSSRRRTRAAWRWRSPAPGISGIELDRPRASSSPSFFVSIAKTRKRKSPDEPVNQRELAGSDGNDERPDKKFAEAQAALPGGGEPELQFCGANRDDVAVAKG